MVFASKKSRVLKSLMIPGAIIAMSLMSSCGGSLLGGEFSAEFVYIATGTNIKQYALDINGQLTALNPVTVTATNVVAVTTSKAGDYAYALNQSTNQILQYSIPASGLLTALTPATVTTDSHPVAIEESIDGKYVYVLCSTSNTICQYSVGASGELSALSPASVPVASDGNSLVVSPTGGFLYATSYSTGKLSAYSIGSNGQLTPLSVPTYDVTTPTGPNISPDGKYMYVPGSTAGVYQFSIGTDGALTPLSPATVASPGNGNDSIALTPDGKFAYLGVFNGGVAGSPVAQYSVGTGGTLSALTPASVAAGNAPNWVLVEPAGKYVYVANSNDGTMSQFSIGADGTLSALSPATVNTSGAIQFAMATR